jgi:hypothetical protein
MVKTASKDRKNAPTKPKPDVAKELAEALAEKPENASRHATASPMPQMGDKIVPYCRVTRPERILKTH